MKDGASRSSAGGAVCFRRSFGRASRRPLRYPAGAAPVCRQADSGTGRSVCRACFSRHRGPRAVCRRRHAAAVSVSRADFGRGALVSDLEPSVFAVFGALGTVFCRDSAENSDTVLGFLRKNEKNLQKYLFIFQEMVYNIRQGKIAEKSGRNRRFALCGSGKSRFF